MLGCLGVLVGLGRKVGRCSDGGRQAKPGEGSAESLWMDASTGASPVDNEVLAWHSRQIDSTESRTVLRNTPLGFQP